MCAKSRGRKQDKATLAAIIRREQKRREVQDRQAAKELGLSYSDYMRLMGVAR